LADDKQNQEAKESQEVKKKKSPLMLIIIIVVVLAAFGAGGYFFLSKGSLKSPDAEKTTNITYYPLKSFVTNLAGDQGTRYLKVTMQFGISDPSLSEELKANSVAIRDAIIAILSSKMYDDIASEDGKQLLKEQIKHAVNRILKKGKIDEVFFTEFVIQ